MVMYVRDVVGRLRNAYRGTLARLWGLIRGASPRFRPVRLARRDGSGWQRLRLLSESTRERFAPIPPIPPLPPGPPSPSSSAGVFGPPPFVVARGSAGAGHCHRVGVRLAGSGLAARGIVH